MYAHVAASTGWSWEYIDNEVTLPILTALHNYWDDCPPVHVLVACYLGLKPKKKAGSHEEMIAAMSQFEGVPGFGKKVKCPTT